MAVPVTSLSGRFRGLAPAGWIAGLVLLAGAPACSDILGYGDIAFAPDSSALDGSAGEDSGSAGGSGKEGGFADTGGANDGAAGGSIDGSLDVAPDGPTDGATGSGAVTGPAFAMSNESGANSGWPNTIINPTFTISLSNPAEVSLVSFQMTPWVDPPTWAEYGAWTSPSESQWTHTVPFYTPGMWSARLIVTHHDATQIESAHHALECVKFAIQASVDNSAPTVGGSVSLGAGMSPQAPAAFPNAPEGWWANRLGAGWVSQGTTANPLTWTPGDTAAHEWMWIEVFPDGSRIHSNAVNVSPQAVPVPTEVVVDGGSCGTGAMIQVGMDSAAAQGLPLRLVGTFYIWTTIYTPDNLYISAAGARFYVSSTLPPACGGSGAYDAGRIRNDTKGNAPGYGQAGGFTWDGGEFDGNRDGIMTFSHSPGFTIKNCTFYSWCYYNSSTDNSDGHAIEINSSGGADNVSGPYNVQILNNTFLGVYSQRPWSNDEPVQWDWNWNGSGGTAPYWEVGDPANSTTQTMCHNVLIQGNTFHRRDESGTWQFALCAIGGHDSSNDAIRPATRHNHFLIDGNAIHGAVGASAGVQSDKGAIHLFRVRQAVVTNNAMFGCTASRLVSAENQTDSTYCSASGNTHNGAPAGNTIVVQGAAPEDQ